MQLTLKPFIMIRFPKKDSLVIVIIVIDAVRNICDFLSKR